MNGKAQRVKHIQKDKETLGTIFDIVVLVDKPYFILMLDDNKFTYVPVNECEWI